MRIFDWLRDGFGRDRGNDRVAAKRRSARAERQEREDPSGPHHFGRRAHRPDPNGRYEFGSDPGHRMVRPSSRAQ